MRHSNGSGPAGNGTRAHPISAREVESAFELLIEQIALVAQDIHAKGAEAFAAGDRVAVDEQRGKWEELDRVMARLGELQESWLETFPGDEASERRPSTDSDGLRLRMRYRHAVASASYDCGRVKLKAGSTINPKAHSSLLPKYRALRESAARDGGLVGEEGGKVLKLTRDVGFSSPSGAAGFVGGCSLSGNRDWILEGTNMTLGQWLRGTAPRA